MNSFLTAETLRTLRRLVMLLSILAVVWAAGFLYYGLTLPGRLRVTHHDVYIDNLPKSFEGFTIVQLTDIHQGIWIKPRHVRHIVVLVNEMHPDLILLTGDYVTRDSRNIEPVGRALRGLKAKHGVYAVLGNHDYWTDAPRMTRALRSSGIDVMINENRRIEVGGSSVYLAGFDDIWAGNPDYDLGLKGIPSGKVCLAMAHNPDAADVLRDKPVDFLISGHLHGGLVNIPGYGSVLKIFRPNPFFSGMHDIGHLQLYISNGIGDSGTPIRINCPTEIPIFTLHTRTH